MKFVVFCVIVCVSASLAAPSQQQEEDNSRLRRSPEEKKDEGWVVTADKTNNGGTVVRGEANKEWNVSNDGKVKAEVHGHWERVYGGPNNGQRSRGVGGSIGGSWGR